MMETFAYFACGVGAVLVGVAAYGEFLTYKRANLLMKELSNSSNNPEAAVANIFGDKPVQMHQIKPLNEIDSKQQENSSHSNTNKFLEESFGKETPFVYDVYQLKSENIRPTYVSVSKSPMMAVPVGDGVHTYYKWRFGDCVSHNKVQALKTIDSSMGWERIYNDDAASYCKTYYIVTRDEFANFCFDINKDYKQIEFNNNTNLLFVKLNLT